MGKEVDTKNTVLSVFLDLSKAFDTLDHKILLQKLKHYGADELAISLFTSYLSGRKQALNINGTVSDWKNITTGVPQQGWRLLRMVTGAHLLYYNWANLCLSVVRYTNSEFFSDHHQTFTIVSLNQKEDDRRN